MLTLTLFGAIFSSAVWLIYAVRFVNSSLSGMSLFDAGILNVLLYVLFICLPVFLLWAVFGFISQYLYNRTVARQMFRLFSQMKKNQEYSDLLARIMLETEQNIKNSFILSKFDLLIADMNELLSEFLQRERLISVEQTEHLWTKVQNGGKWSFGKVLIENYNRQPSFQKRIYDDAGKDPLLAGTVLEFCARYQTLLTILEKHDKERVLLGIIETGVFGKVFAILAPVADEIRRTREAFAPEEKSLRQQFRSEPAAVAAVETGSATEDEESARRPDLTEKVNHLFSRFIPGKKQANETSEPQKDAFSLALERSFGTETPPKNEPVFEISEPKAVPPTALSDEPAAEEGIIRQKTEKRPFVPSDITTDTEKTLDSLKKEWQHMDLSAGKSSEDDNLTYPFGGWTDAENYKK